MATKQDGNIPTSAHFDDRFAGNERGGDLFPSGRQPGGQIPIAGIPNPKPQYLQLHRCMEKREILILGNDHPTGCPSELRYRRIGRLAAKHVGNMDGVKIALAKPSAKRRWQLRVDQEFHAAAAITR